MPHVMVGHDGVPLRALRPIAGWLQAEGHSVQRILDDVGIAAERLFDPEARISVDAWIALWRRAEIVARDPAIGLHIAAMLDMRLFGAPVATEFTLLQLVATSATVGVALERFARFAAIGFGPMRLEVLDGEPTTELRLRLPEDLGWPSSLVEWLVATVVGILRDLPVQPVVPMMVHLRHPAPSSVAEHRRVFGAPVRFAEPIDSIEIPAARLRDPLKYARASLAAALERRAEEELARLRPPDHFLERVSAVLEAQLAQQGNPTAEGVARALQMSVRSLSRKLAEHGTTHRSLLDSLRARLAQRMLAEGAHVKDVARRLGFADSSAFHRAFRRWHGKSPTQYRDARP